MLKQITSTHRALGTNNILTIFGSTDQKILDQSNALIDYYDDLLTISRPISEVIAVNENAGIKPVAVSNATFQLIKTAVEVSRENHGFNALIGPLVNLWRIGYEDARIPTDDEIKEKLALINPQNVEFDEENLSVYLTKSGMELDLGGIGKGYIADRIQNLWQAYDINSGIINLGGNLVFHGKSPKHADGKWIIGVQDPDLERNQTILTVNMPACSAVTSGIYERKLTKNNQSYHHILDPKTGYPKETNILGVTVFTKTSLLAEIKTTEAFFDEKVDFSEINDEYYGAVFITKNHEAIVYGLKDAPITLTNTDYDLIIAK